MNWDEFCERMLAWSATGVILNIDALRIDNQTILFRATDGRKTRQYLVECEQVDE